KKIAFFLDQSDPLAFAKKLQDFEGGDYRWRVGKYRIIFDVDETQKIILVLHIDHRRSAYR
ncbi:MAG: type II toxin-antitoxin system RelE/ParE family toxin, partial [Patescibacteria group bacterium]